MKRTLMTAGFLLLLSMALVYAQTNTMDQASEKNVQITSGPNITNISGSSATIHWTTNKAGANHVKYRVAGTGNWQSAYHAGGGTDHTLQLTGLQPGQTYEWQILTRDGDVRTSGQFQTAATAGGNAPDVNATSAAQPGAAAPAAPSAGKVPVYRFVNSGNGEHYFSTSTSAPGGFKEEGIGFYVLPSQAPGTTPLYMLTNPTDAMISTSTNEGGYQNSGTLGYIYTSQQPGTQPLYRMLDPRNGKHFATASAQEHAQGLSGGLKDDGIAGYVWTQ